MGEETPMVSYLNVHAALEQKRDWRRTHPGTDGPRVSPDGVEEEEPTDARARMDRWRKSGK